MLNSKQKILGLIPARGGSKRLPRKNILPCAGRPLIAWTIEAARQSKLIDSVWVSTDDAEISGVARRWGANVLYRPQHIAQDDSPTEAVVAHALRNLHVFGAVFLLQPTSPLRTAQDCDRAILESFGYQCLISGIACGTGHRLKPDGAIYVTDCGWFAETGKLWDESARLIAMPGQIDIDTAEDFVRVEAILNART